MTTRTATPKPGSIFSSMVAEREFGRCANCHGGIVRDRMRPEVDWVWIHSYTASTDCDKERVTSK